MVYKLGRLVQLVGLIFLGMGVGIELAYKADIGYICITVGSVIFAVGCKLRIK